MAWALGEGFGAPRVNAEFGAPYVAHRLVVNGASHYRSKETRQEALAPFPSRLRQASQTQDDLGNSTLNRKPWRAKGVEFKAQASGLEPKCRGACALNRISTQNPSTDKKPEEVSIKNP